MHRMAWINWWGVKREKGCANGVRFDADKRGRAVALVCEPDERVELEMALRMQTVNAAHTSLDEVEEVEMGSIEAGELADLVVLSEDLRRVGAKGLWDVPVWR